VARRPETHALQASRRHEAYQTLKDPVARAEYLLHVRGVDATSDGQPPRVAFLTRQLERREAADEAVENHDAPALTALLEDVDADAAQLRTDVEHALDGEDLEVARSRVRELRFLSKLAEDLDAMQGVEQDG
jgi:molecular chaperone HscB